MIKKILKNFFYLLKISPALMTLFFLNIFFTTLVKLSSFKKTIKISQKKVQIICNPLIKTRHILVFQDLISKLLPYNTCLVKALSVHKLS